MTMVEAAAIVLFVATAAAAALVGCFALMRRMTLAADALSHVALPGIGVAIALHVHPLFGGVSALLLGGVLVWGLERRTRIATETVIGVVFATALAAGALMTSGEDLIMALFGGDVRPTVTETLLGVLAAAVAIAFLLRQRHRLILMLVSSDIARTAGIDVARLDLQFLLVFALTIALGLRYLGVLLVGALAIIPAATAKRLGRDLRAMLSIAVAVAVISTLAGTYIAGRLHREPGPVVVLCAGACFFSSLLLRPKAA